MAQARSRLERGKSVAQCGLGLSITLMSRNCKCDNKILGRLSCYPCYSKSEGNTLAATEFIRLLEASGSITAQH